MTERFYVASRATPQNKIMWRNYRDRGVPIISSWIDGANDPTKVDFSLLWETIAFEVGRATRLVLYITSEDLPVKGALVEVGMALSHEIPVYCVLPGVVLEHPSMGPVGSWLYHPRVRLSPFLENAFTHKEPRA